MKRRGRTTVLRDQRVSRKKKGGKSSSGKRSIAFLPANFLTYATVIISILLVAVFVKTYVSSLAFLGLPRINIEGNELLPEQKIITAGGFSGCSIFSFSASDAVEELKKIPWIKSVSVRKKLPNSVYINIEERKPFAWLDNNGLKLVDEFGVVLDSMPQVKTEGLLTIKGIGNLKIYRPGEKVEGKGMEEAVAVIKQISTGASWIKDKVAEIDVKDSNNPVLVMNSYSFQVYLGDGMITEKMDNLKKVFYSFNDEERTRISLFDLRFKDRVIIRTDNKTQPEEKNVVKET